MDGLALGFFWPVLRVEVLLLFGLRPFLPDELLFLLGLPEAFVLRLANFCVLALCLYHQ